MILRKTLIGGAVVILIVVVAVGALWYLQLRPKPIETIKIGIIGPFTGPVAEAGKLIQYGAIMAIEELNEEGGALGKKIEYVLIDSESDPTKAMSAFERAVEREGIHIAACGYHSSVGLALMDLAAKYKIVVVGHCGQTEEIIKKYQSDPEKYKYWFRGMPALGKIAEWFAPAIQDAIEKGLWTPRNLKLGIVQEETDAGRSLAEGYTKSFKKYGWEIAYTTFVPLGETEFTPIITKLKAVNVSLVCFTVSGTASMSAFIKQARDLELNAVIQAYGLGWFPGWYEVAGEAGNYVIDMQAKASTATQIEFVKKFEKRWGIKLELISIAGIMGYDPVKFAINAIRAAGTLDSDVLVKTIQKMEFRGGVVMPCYKYDIETHDLVMGPGYYLEPIIQYFHGVGYAIWPSYLAEQNFRPPPWA